MGPDRTVTDGVAQDGRYQKMKGPDRTRPTERWPEIGRYRPRDNRVLLTSTHVVVIDRRPCATSIYRDGSSCRGSTNHRAGHKDGGDDVRAPPKTNVLETYSATLSTIYHRASSSATGIAQATEVPRKHESICVVITAVISNKHHHHNQQSSPSSSTNIVIINNKHHRHLQQQTSSSSTTNIIIINDNHHRHHQHQTSPSSTNIIIVNKHHRHHQQQASPPSSSTTNIIIVIINNNKHHYRHHQQYISSLSSTTNRITEGRASTAEFVSGVTR